MTLLPRFADDPAVPQLFLFRGDSEHCVSALSGHRVVQPTSTAGGGARRAQEVQLQRRRPHDAAQHLQGIQKSQRQQGEEDEPPGGATVELLL